MTLQGRIYLIRPESFEHIHNWIKDAKSAAKKNCAIVVVGNKTDLKEQRLVKYTDGAKLCQDNSK